MEQVNLKDFKIIPILDSLKQAKISDEEYFSKKYSNYVSNSRLKNIDPTRGGSPELYKNPPKFSTTSLAIGSCVHEVVLQPESFKLLPKQGKPSAKLGTCIDYIFKYRKEGNSIKDSITMASNSASYYAGKLSDSKIKMIIKKGLPYYMSLLKLELKDGDILLSDTDWDVATSCINSLNKNLVIMNKLHPTTVFDEIIPSYNEDAMFIDFCVMYKDRATILKYKMKIDNWTIDIDNKKVTLNDIKTTRDNPDYFMAPGAHFDHYRYDIQGALYGDILKLYCMQKYGYNEDDWTFEVNFLAVKNNYPFNSKCCNMNSYLYNRGKISYQNLLKRVAYYEIFGYDKEVEFV